MVEVANSGYWRKLGLVAGGGRCDGGTLLKVVVGGSQGK